jgi:hypothetical protein
VVAGTNGMLQQFALRPGDIVNPMIRPAGILVPERPDPGLLAGFGQIESQVIKVGMIGEVTCLAKPWQIIPMVVTEVQPSSPPARCARPTPWSMSSSTHGPAPSRSSWSPSTKGQLDDLPLGGNCIANALHQQSRGAAGPDIGTLHSLGLHAIDTVGLVHALILRLKAALLLPIQTLVLGGH